MRDILKIGFNRWSIIAILLSGVSIITMTTAPSLYPFSISLFLVASLISYLFWTSIGIGLGLLPTFISWVFRFLLTFLVVVFLATGYQFYIEFKEFISPDLVTFLQEQSVYFVGYATQVLKSPIQTIAILGLVILLTFALKPPKITTKKLKHFGLFLLLFIGSFIGVNQIGHAHLSHFLPIDIHNFFSFRKSLNRPKDKTKKLVHFPAKLPQTAQIKDQENWNIVLFVFESLSKEPLSFYNYNNSNTPFLDQWIKKESGQFVLMQNAMSISGSTDISMPSIFTGIGPHESYGKLTSTPFMWDFAKLKNYETYYFTSQSQEWKEMRKFVHDKYLDHYNYAEQSGLPFVNDLGVDDLEMVDLIKPIFQKAKNPFFLLYNTNATHTPYQNESSKINHLDTIDSRYGKALLITDQTVARITQIVQNNNQMDSTIFIFTADHGAITVKKKQRLFSFYKETLDIPMMIRLPKKWIKKHPNSFSNLRQNSTQTISNLDLAPTVLKLLYPELDEKEYQFTGNNLLQPLPKNRTIICLSTNDTRSWTNEGFGIYRTNECYIFDNIDKQQFYDLSIDPNQDHNIIDSISTSKKEAYEHLILNNEYLKRVFLK